MEFDKYFNMWNKYGVKLPTKIEITKEILNRVSRQNEVCDLIWVINAASQTNKSSTNLSNTALEQFHKLSPSLLSHKAFKDKKGYSIPSNVVDRAISHFNDDPNYEDRFIKRQPKIKSAFEGNDNKTAQQTPIKENSTIIPTKEDFASAYRALTRLGERGNIDAILDQIEIHAAKECRILKSNWRMITEENIKIWLKK